MAVQAQNAPNVPPISSISPITFEEFCERLEEVKGEILVEGKEVKNKVDTIFYDDDFFFTPVTVRFPCIPTLSDGRL